MALATNLKVDPAVAAAFTRSESQSEGVAAPVLLTLALEGAEVKLVSSEESDAQPTVDLAFSKIGDAIGDGSSARLFLFKAADAGHRGHVRWTVVSFVPESTPPKTKMLLAAARDDVKKSLEAARLSPDFAKLLLTVQKEDSKRELEGSRFTPDYAVTERDELTAAAFQQWRSRDRESAMSARELAMQVVIAESNAARLASGGKMAGMAQVPFKLDDKVLQACAKTAPKFAAPAAAGSSSPKHDSAPSPASHGSHDASSASNAAASADEASSGSGGATGSPSTVLSPTSSAMGGSGAPAGGEGASSGSSATSSTAAAAATPVMVAAPEFDFVEMAIAGETVLLAGEPRLIGDSADAHKTAIKASVLKEGPKAPAGSPGAAAAATAVAKAISPGLPGVAKVEPRYFLMRLGYGTTPAALPSECTKPSGSSFFCWAPFCW